MNLDQPAQPALDWVIAGRPGYAGSKGQKRANSWNRQFGEGNWRISYLWQGQRIDRDAALVLYEEAYFQHLTNSPETLEWLCLTASDVYDIQPSNVESGTDFHRQECGATHLQDIAVRRVLQRLGRRFRGDHLLQIRGHTSERYRLNPGKVPFHQPEGILHPSLSAGQWWDAGSVEDFWQTGWDTRENDPI